MSVTPPRGHRRATRPPLLPVMAEGVVMVPVAHPRPPGPPGHARRVLRRALRRPGSKASPVLPHSICLMCWSSGSPCSSSPGRVTAAASSHRTSARSSLRCTCASATSWPPGRPACSRSLFSWAVGWPSRRGRWRGRRRTWRRGSRGDPGRPSPYGRRGAVRSRHRWRVRVGRGTGLRTVRSGRR